MKLRTLLTVLVVAPLLAGCGLFDRKSDFDKVPEERPLEVPPDLDAPDESGALRVPNSTYSRVARGPVESPSATPGADALPEGEGTRLIRDGSQPRLVVEDTAESVFRRLGFALERVGLEIVERDQFGTFYLVEYIDTEARANRPGLFSRWILRRKGPTDYSGVYRVSVRNVADATVVTLLDEDGERAPDRVVEDVLSALEERLG